MDYSRLPFYLVVVLSPGIISTLIYKTFTIGKDWDSFKFGTFTVLFSGISYVITYGILLVLLTGYNLYSQNDINIEYLNVTKNVEGNVYLEYSEIFISCCLSVLIGIIAVKIKNGKFLYYLLSNSNITSKFGDESLFYNMLKSHPADTSMYIKDIDNNIIYHGYIDAYSEDDNNKEITLYNVDVYSNDPLELSFSADNLYITFPQGHRLIIESNQITINEEENDSIGEKEVAEPSRKKSS